MTRDHRPARRAFVLAAGIVAIGFGILTLVSGGTVLFGGADARSAAGNVVAFVLWFNFLSGFAYLVIGAALILQRPWAARAAWVLVAAITAVGAAFAAHVLSGGAYEPRTVAAMTLRALVWVMIAAITCRAFACFGHRTTT